MRITPPLRSVVFFNPPRIGAYKIEYALKGLLKWFFNPLKIGAYKILNCMTNTMTKFFNPLKIGAYKITKNGLACF